MKNETHTILDLEFDGRTVEDYSNDTLRWLPDDFLSYLREIGLSDKQIIENHKKLMGADGYLTGHTNIIGNSGKKLQLPHLPQIAFETHDLAEALLYQDGRISDYQTGRKTAQNKLDEQDRMIMLLDNVLDRTDRDIVLSIIEKQGQYGQMLKQVEQKQFLSHAKYMQNRLKTLRADNQLELDYSKLMQQLITEVNQKQ